MGCLESELSITLVSDAEIAEIAGRFGRDAEPTDVLAFPTREGPGAEYRGALIGDVVLSVETAERQAHARRTSLDLEMRDLVIHGVLHLMGMDHERVADGRCMRALEDHMRWAIDGLD